MGNDSLSSHVLEGQGDVILFPISGSKLSLRQVEFLLAYFDMGRLGINLSLDPMVGEGVHLYVRICNLGEYVGVVSGVGEEIVKINAETG